MLGQRVLVTALRPPPSIQRTYERSPD